MLIAVSVIFSNLIFFYSLKLKQDTCRFILLFLSVITFIPVLISNSIQKDFSIHVLFGTILFFIFTLIGCFLLRKVKFEATPAFPKTLFIFISAVCISITLIFFEIHSFSDVISDIYGTRQNMRDTVPFFQADRIYGFATRFGLIFMICYGVVYRGYLMVVCGLIATLALFLIAGHKSIIVLSMVALVLSFLITKNVSPNIIIYRILLTVISIIFVEELLEYYVITDFLIRRVIVLPSNLTYYYFEAFITDPNIFRSNFIERGSIPFHIASEYFNRGEMRANSNILSSSVVSLGYFSLIFTALTFGMLLQLAHKIIDSIRHPKTKLLMTAIIYCYAWSLTESAFSIVLFTHGLFLFFIPFIFNRLFRGNNVQGKI